VEEQAAGAGWAILAADRVAAGDAVVPGPVRTLHSMDRHLLLKAVEVMAACMEERADEVSALRAAGFSASEGRVLVDALPEAFAVPVVEELGCVVDELGSVRNSAGEWVKVLLADSSIFVAALDLSRQHRITRTMPQEAYEAIAMRSALLGAVGKALDAGVDIKGASLAIALIAATAEDFEAARGRPVTRQ
jgi:hypothetical protein